MHGTNAHVGASLDATIIAALDWSATLVAEAVADDVWAPNESHLVRPLDKMLAEAALLAHIADRALAGEPAVARLLDAIASRTEDLDRIYELIAGRPHFWDSLGFSWVVLGLHGRGDGTKRSRLRELWTSQVRQPHECIPFRALDHAWVRSIALNRTDPMLDSAGLYACTALANVEAGFHMKSIDLYAVTHTAMFVTDFGRTAAPVVPSGWIVPLGLSRLLIGDFDLTAELAMTAMLLGDAKGDVGMRAMASALGTQFAALGYVPSPTFRTDAYEKSKNKDSYLAYHVYHTTFVFGLLCCVLRLSADPDPQLAAELSKTQGALPTEWDGRRLQIPTVAVQVGHTFQAWREFDRIVQSESDDRQLLREILDAYLLRAVSENAIDDLASLFGMARVAGISPIHDAAWKLVDRRTRLSGYEFSGASLGIGCAPAEPLPVR
ncbi:MAG: hypothetical protein QOK02_6640 [Mycobacterium sp.]|nr:hypothetical protein [Mycobacterium sp.]